MISIDFDDISDMISKYRNLLNRERNNAFLQQFDQFLLDAANISDETLRNEMTARLNEVLTALTQAALEPHEILIEFSNRKLFKT